MVLFTVLVTVSLLQFRMLRQEDEG
jgi:hypothetical protein